MLISEVPKLNTLILRPAAKLILPWPACLWKPELGAVEASLARSLSWRAALSVISVIFLCCWAAVRMARGADAAECIYTAAVFALFVLLVLLVIYPHQRRREVRLPFYVALSPEGIFFRLAQPIRVDWASVDAYALCDSVNPQLKRFEVLVSRNGRQFGLAFPYDTEEIDEALLRDLLAYHLPDRERRTVCSIDFSQAGNRSRN